MKKILFFALILLAVASCKKNNDSSDPVEPTDPREAFVGEYQLVLSGTATLSASNETIASMLPESIDIADMYDEAIALTIKKDPASDNQVILSSKIYNCKALVSGNNLVLESSTEVMDVEIGEIADLGIDIGSVPVHYTFVHKVASLADGVLTWHTDANLSTTISVAIISVDLTADAGIENTATKVK